MPPSHEGRKRTRNELDKSGTTNRIGGKSHPMIGVAMPTRRGPVRTTGPAQIPGWAIPDHQTGPLRIDSARRGEADGINDRPRGYQSGD